MAYTLAEAARASGLAKSSVLRAIKRGVISAMRDTATGQWLVEPAELHRVYPPADEAGARTEAIEADAPVRTAAVAAELREARALLSGAISQLADAHATIDDLRRRLDASEMERRAERERNAALLTDQRVQRRHWWRWGRG